MPDVTQESGDSADRAQGKHARMSGQEQGSTGVDRPLESRYLVRAFEDAAIGMAIVDLDEGSIGRVLRANRALSELTGYTRAELEAGGIGALLHPDEREGALAAMAKLAAGELTGLRLEQRLVHAERYAVWVIVCASVVRDARGPAYCVWQVLDIEERKRFEGELGYLADHDPLTGLLNRRGFVRELSNQIAHARRYGGGGAVLFLDIDDFKYVNDTLGHSVGDEVIGSVARVVERRVRETDVCARLGGDEFGVLLPHATAKDAETLSASLLGAVRGLDALSLRSGRAVTVSVGVTVFSEPAADLSADDILIDSDLAMYAAKGAGKDRYAVASPDNQKRIRARVTWADRVRRALREDRFELYCQPIVALDTGTTSHWELLLRLQGDEGELILPAQFLYTAERSGLILAIDRWVIGEAVRMMAAEQAFGREPHSRSTCRAGPSLTQNCRPSSRRSSKPRGSTPRSWCSRSPKPPPSRTSTAPASSPSGWASSAAASPSTTSAPDSARSTT